MIATSRNFLPLMRVASFAIVIWAVGCAIQANEADDDGWRRTKDGWERMSSWNLGSRMLPANRTVLKARATGPSWDVHPAFVATGLLILATTCLTISPAINKRA
ncbi:hypothetical protein NA78x_003805 [Anatilimnocola sp. NA78]|uniref:hypothetical protein n=1 Tax=Anatilimnocola sp. NA78 TaxID=3415683 RepID=UPI003CE5B169